MIESRSCKFFSYSWLCKSGIKWVSTCIWLCSHLMLYFQSKFKIWNGGIYICIVETSNKVYGVVWMQSLNKSWLVKGLARRVTVCWVTAQSLHWFCSQHLGRKCWRGRSKAPDFLAVGKYTWWLTLTYFLTISTCNYFLQL